MDKLLVGYNNTPHSGIANKTPISIRDDASEWARQHAQLLKPKRKPKLNIGDTVRLQKAKKTFDRGYTPNWTEELFKIHAIDKTWLPITYQVEDDDGEIIEGQFYYLELQKVEPIYRIEKILKSKIVKGKKYLLVKWLGDRYPHPEWILESNINETG